MAKSFTLEILTPEGQIFSGKVESLVVKTRDGFEGFLAGHLPVCKLLAEDGEVSYKAEGDNEFKKIKICGGFIEAKGDIMICADK